MALKTPALNERSPRPGIKESDATPRGMTAAGTYVITSLLLVMGVAAVAFGWSQVEIVTVGGREEALIPFGCGSPSCSRSSFQSRAPSPTGPRRPLHLVRSHARFRFHREGGDGGHAKVHAVVPRVRADALPDLDQCFTPATGRAPSGRAKVDGVPTTMSSPKSQVNRARR
jgi:hypothetical protein